MIGTKMKGLHKTCQGASHIKSNKVCQDYSYCESSPKLSIALVSDGHGGDRYFRSHIGSELACTVSSELIHTFVSELPIDFFEGVPLTQYGVNGASCGQPSKNHIETLRQLGKAIIAHWRDRVESHAKTHPLTQEEILKVPEEYHKDLTDKDRLVKVYGCTLIAYVQTPTYWFGFQIGDGKCFSFHHETGPKEPILWDDACFLNKTTSLCDSYASEKFRYSFQGDGGFPFAVFMGSDGLDDSFGEDKNLINFYIQVLKLAYRNGAKEVEAVLESDLPVLSKRGSQDDMSVAAIFDDTCSSEALKELIQWQLNTTLGELNQNKARIHKFHKERKSLLDAKDSNPKAAIDYDYAVKEILTAFDVRKKLITRYNVLALELDNENPKSFNDDIPYEKVIPQSSIKQDGENKVEPASAVTQNYEKKKDSVPHLYGKLRRVRDKRFSKHKHKFVKKKGKNRH